MGYSAKDATMYACLCGRIAAIILEEDRVVVRWLFRAYKPSAFAEHLEEAE